jgi:hypothetical protein
MSEHNLTILSTNTTKCGTLGVYDYNDKRPSPILTRCESLMHADNLHFWTKIILPSQTHTHTGKQFHIYYKTNFGTIAVLYDLSGDRLYQVKLVDLEQKLYTFIDAEKIRFMGRKFLKTQMSKYRAWDALTIEESL